MAYLPPLFGAGLKKTTVSSGLMGRFAHGPLAFAPCALFLGQSYGVAAAVIATYVNVFVSREKIKPNHITSAMPLGLAVGFLGLRL